MPVEFYMAWLNGFYEIIDISFENVVLGKANLKV
jgi:hypothetical protein